MVQECWLDRVIGMKRGGKVFLFEGIAHNLALSSQPSDDPKVVKAYAIAPVDKQVQLIVAFCHIRYN